MPVTMRAGKCVVGIDIGTTAIKAILIDTTGTRLDAFRRPVPMSRPSPGYAEQEPNDWTNGVVAALTEFAARHDLSGLAGIGICSQVNTHVFVGSDEQPLIPAITWQDTRCAADAAALDAQVSAVQKTAWFGGPVPIDASHALARMVYMARVHPDLYSRTRHVLLPKDYCVLRLTGSVVSDAVAAVGLAGHDGYVGELQYMLDCIRAGKNPDVVTAQDGASAVAICEAEDRSVKSGQIVSLD